MEEIAFGVVSTAYENWSYDESGSDPEYQSFGGGFNSSLLSTTANTPSLLPLEVDRNWPGWGNADFETRILHSDNQQNPFWADVQAPDDTKYERNIWTGEVTATSPASSANSDLRAPYPVDYLSAGSAGSESNSFPRRKSTIVKRTTTKKKTEGTKRVGRRKGPLRPDQRHQAAEIRKLRACLRCKFLKKTCDKGDPCSGCQPSHARLWTVPCTRINIKDLGYFLKDWKADYERHLTLGFSAVFVKGFSSQERLLHLTHGYGHYLSLSAREVYLRDGCDLGVDWVEAKQTESGSRVHQQFKVDTAKLSAGIEGISSADMMAYLDKHIDHGFEDFVDAHFEGTPFLTEFLKTTYRCMVRDKSAVLRKALRFLVAYNLTLNLTMMEAGPEDDGSGRVQDPDSKLFGKIATPVTINFQVKYCLADIWREIHKDLLQDLGAFYESVYGGEKLRNWGSIFFITLILLAVWEEMQFDCHYRIHDEAACRKFCSDMETVPLATLLGLFYAISQKLPPIAEWEFANSISGFNPSEALRDAMMEMRSHVIKYESYLRSRLTDATFDREDFDSLSNKFLARLVLRGNMTASSHVS
ncbi:hypothetical protein K458DRAFT_289859 [Lentithecium fluviatile CBS 122367]|uniref:Zn(2)-C6 fungal-type domain-containing protein n=1 Tax=Lentithecium fluviatile CBS 122367 TaxID=1168545 RepID=A0A6G1JIV9_9PLEO|nr:hypothetical protein K458DRAFT_289859 [Lentithecium fluviatile CBS 122367]